MLNSVKDLFFSNSAQEVPSFSPTVNPGEGRINLNNRHPHNSAQPILAIPSYGLQMILSNCDVADIIHFRSTCQNAYVLSSEQEKMVMVLRQQCTPLLEKEKITNEEREDLETHYLELEKLLLNPPKSLIAQKNTVDLANRFLKHFFMEDLAQLSSSSFSQNALKVVADWNMALFTLFLMMKYKRSAEEKANFFKEMVKSKCHINLEDAENFWKDLTYDDFGAGVPAKFTLLHKMLILKVTINGHAQDLHNIVDQLMPHFLKHMGPDINVFDTHPDRLHTALSRACQFDPNLIRQVLERGANVDSQNAYGMTPLMKLCEYQRDNILPKVNVLLEYNPNLMLRNKKGLSVFEIAKQNDNVGVQRLLKSYIDNKYYLLKLQDLHNSFVNQIVHKMKYNPMETILILASILTTIFALYLVSKDSNSLTD